MRKSGINSHIIDSFDDDFQINDNLYSEASSVHNKQYYSHNNKQFEEQIAHTKQTI